MKNKLLILLAFSMGFASFSQEDAWVYLIDKSNVEASLNDPTLILTERAILRKMDHNIPIDERDVPVNESYISNIKSQTGITVLAKSKWFNALHVRGTENNINNLLNLNYVDHIEFANDDLNTQSRLQRTKDKFKVEDTQVDFTYGTTSNQVTMIGADYLHQQDFTGEGILIAVMDSGFPNVNTMKAFQRSRTNGDIVGGYDFQRRTSDIYGYTGNAHGTWVLSDMAGYIEDQFVGTAPDATYILFRTEVAEFENPVEESYWVEAAERADSLGVDLINTSLGYKNYDNPSYSYSNSEMDGETAFITRGATIANEKGMLVVTSAGNSGTSGIGAPADAAAVFSIGAVDANENYVSFSSRGSSLQPTIKPDVAARGLDAFAVNVNGAIVQLDGTSFSSPIMAGGMACLMQALPDASVDELRQIVRETASQASNPDFFLGYGVPDLQMALAQPSLDEINSDGNFKLFPNPVKNTLHIQLGEDQKNTSIQLFDILGKLVFEAKLSQTHNRIDTSYLQRGMCLLKFKGSINKTIKLVKS